MNTQECRAKIVDLEKRQAPQRSGGIVLAIFGLLVGALIAKTFPWLTPVWLGPIILSAVVADIWSIAVLRRERLRLAEATVYRINLPTGTIFVTDDAAITSLVRRSTLVLPVGAGVVVAIATAAFFIHRHGFGFWSVRTGLLPVLQCTPILGGVAGIYGAVLLSRKVITWRLAQGVLRSAGVPHRHILASTTFILSTLLSLYVLGGFGKVASEALRPVPPPKTIGDLIFSSPSPKGTYLIEHRESLNPKGEERCELYFVDPNNPSRRTLLLSYARAAKVTFSPDESHLIISEKTRGFIRPLFFTSVQNLRGGTPPFARSPRENMRTLDERIRREYATPERPSANGNIRVREWSTEEEVILFSFESAKDQAGNAQRENALCVWDYKSDLFTKIEGSERSETATLASFLSEREQKLKEWQKGKVEASVVTMMGAINGRHPDALLAAYAPLVAYHGEGFKTREVIQEKWQEEFQQWPERNEVIEGTIDVAPKENGKWQATWKTTAELRKGLTEKRTYECEFADMNGRVLITLENISVSKQETVTETPIPQPVVPQTQGTTPEKPIAAASTPPPPKPPQFPEGKWIIHSQTRGQDENTLWNNVLTVRGTSFQYDMTQTHALIDPVNNPWTEPAILRGLRSYSYTSRFVGKVIRSDAHSFVVKVESQKVINKKPEGLAVKITVRREGSEWTFLRTNGGGLVDKNEPSSVFQNVSQGVGRQ